MSSSRERRVMKELGDMDADRESGVFAVSADGDSLKNLTGIITGPPDSPYGGATYEIEITIPDMYPFKSPTMKFKTKIWHPNISSQTGAICLDTLGTGWSPVQTIKTSLLSLRMLLEFPNPKDPQDAEVAKMLMEDPEQFALKAQQWAVKYAGAQRQELDLSKYKSPEAKPTAQEEQYQGYNKNLVGRFVSMGFDVKSVVDAFLYVGIPRNGGRDYELEEAYMGDITARLLGEQ